MEITTPEYIGIAVLVIGGLAFMVHGRWPWTGVTWIVLGVVYASTRALMAAPGL